MSSNGSEASSPASISGQMEGSGSPKCKPSRKSGDGRDVVSERVDELAGLFVGFAFALQLAQSRSKFTIANISDLIYTIPVLYLNRPSPIFFLSATSLLSSAPKLGYDSQKNTSHPSLVLNAPLTSLSPLHPLIASAPVSAAALPVHLRPKSAPQPQGMSGSYRISGIRQKRRFRN